MKFKDMKLWLDRRGSILRRNIRKNSGKVQILAELLFMTAVGGCSVLLAERYPDAFSTAESTIVIYEDTDQRIGIEETAEEQEGENDSSKETQPAEETDFWEETEDHAENAMVENETTDNKDPHASAIRLNMAFLFPEGKETSDPMDSYAGQAYTVLSEWDSAWITEIYGLSDRSPASVAESTGRPLETEVESWENVIVSFYDGDGRPISGYSNAREILSLASVYAYYHEITDGETFISYATVLWKNSHHYDFSISDVYYCDGECLEESVAGNELVQELSPNETEPSVDDISQEETPADMTEEETADERSLEDKFATEDKDALLESANPLEAAELFSLEYLTEETETVNAASQETGAETSTEISTETSAETSTEISAEISAETSVSEPEEAKTSETPQISEVSECPGHIDLKINAYITGLDETKNLFTKDAIGNEESQWTGRWQGWTPFCRLYARGIEQLDWYKAYGLTFSASMYVRNPLSASEISNYMKMLPEGTSEKRKKVIQQALRSVGCIPYYWGGKPSKAGFEGNGFGTIVSPDKNGRILRGLDCSGWISWVYWTALDERLNYESTSGLVAEGRAIERSQLQPGDIILRTGDDSHVYMFMAWAEDGSMYLIHETGGSTNNVMIGRYQLDWPYYRNLINEE